MSFDPELEVVLADTPEARKIHYQLRYQVYCKDRGWEKADRFPDGLEKDDWDDKAVHFIARERHSGEWVAGMRLVIGSPNELPFYSMCQAGGVKLPDSHGDEAGKVIEFSRLHVLRETQTASAMLALIRAARDYSINNGIFSWYFISSDALNRMLMRMGACFEPIAAGIHHRGLRRPFYGDVRWCFDMMKNRHPKIHQWFSKSVWATRPDAYCLHSDLYPALKMPQPAQAASRKITSSYIRSPKFAYRPSTLLSYAAS